MSASFKFIPQKYAKKKGVRQTYLRVWLKTLTNFSLKVRPGWGKSIDTTPFKFKNTIFFYVNHHVHKSSQKNWTEQTDTSEDTDLNP